MNPEKNRNFPRPAEPASVIGAAAAVMLSLAIVTIPAGFARAADGCADPPTELAMLKTDAPRPAGEMPSFVDAAGGAVNILDVARANGAVVNFWATWCVPCIKEMPQLDRLKADLAGDGIPVIAVSQDRGGMDKVEPFFDKQGYENLDIHLDPKGAFARSLKVRGLPTTILFGADGREQGRVEGIAEWDAPAVVAFIRRCLKAGP